MKDTIIKRLTSSVVGALLAISFGTATAQGTFPSRPIRIVVPHVAGGVSDTFARAVGVHLQESLGQPVIIDNKPGGSQVISAMAVATAPADGYTLLLGSTTSLAVNLYTQKHLPYHPVKDFAPISLGITIPLFLVVSPSLPAKNVKELVALLKASPDKYSYGSIGMGSSTHLAAELFQMLTGTKMLHVPYKSSTPVITDLLAGRVDMTFDPSSLPLVREGRLRALGVGSLKRASAMPDLPTIAEAGVPKYDASVWFGFVVPAGTPQPIVDKLSSELNRIISLPEMQAKFTSFGVEMTPSTPKEFGEMIKTEIERWADVARTAGIEPE